MLKFATVLAFVAVLVCSLLLSFIDAAKPKWHQLEGYTFENYVRDFRRQYTGAEYLKRKEIFDKEIAIVKAHNKNGNFLWKRGINHMSDYTQEEKSRLRGFDMSLKQRYLAEHGSKRKMHKMVGAARVLPKTVDYRFPVNGVRIMTAVKDQGDCGSCWAHAATETVETAWALASNELYVLSQQQIASCTVNPNDCGGSGGCNGGIAELAIDTVASVTGLNQEWTYPYVSYFGENFKCNSDALKNYTKVYTTGYTAVQSNNAGAVMDALAFAGPLAMSADASDWPNYESGIYHGCNYQVNISMDHAIQLAGYGSDSGLNADYWIVRNSWNAGWGEDGFIRLLREPQGQSQCGWNVQPQNGNGCKGDTAPVWACGMCGVLYETLYANPRYPYNPF